jgi:hypothetical protein
LQGDAGVKVAPGLPHGLVPAGVEAEWVSDNGDVKEVALWSGALAGESRRRATLLRAVPSSGGADPDGATGTFTLTETDDPGDPGVRTPGRYVYEPDGAVIRAGLVTAVAAIVDGWLLDSSIAYVSGDAFVEVLVHALLHLQGHVPLDLDELGRPRWLYGEETPVTAAGAEPVLGEDTLRACCPVPVRGWINRLGGCATVGGTCSGCTREDYPDATLPLIRAG